MAAGWTVFSIVHDNKLIKSSERKQSCITASETCVPESMRNLGGEGAIVLHSCTWRLPLYSEAYLTNADVVDQVVPSDAWCC